MNKSDTMFENKNISYHKISCSNIYLLLIANDHEIEKEINASI